MSIILLAVFFCPVIVCNHTVTIECYDYFFLRFVKIHTTISMSAKRVRNWKCLIIPIFHEYTIWLPFNIMGDKLSSRNAVFFSL